MIQVSSAFFVWALQLSSKQSVCDRSFRLQQQPCVSSCTFREDSAAIRSVPSSGKSLRMNTALTQPEPIMVTPTCSLKLGVETVVRLSISFPQRHRSCKIDMQYIRMNDYECIWCTYTCTLIKYFVLCIGSNPRSESTSTSTKQPVGAMCLVPCWWIWSQAGCLGKTFDELREYTTKFIYCKSCKYLFVWNRHDEICEESWPSQSLGKKTYTVTPLAYTCDHMFLLVLRSAREPDCRHHGQCSCWTFRPALPSRQLRLRSNRSRKQLGKGTLHWGGWVDWLSSGCGSKGGWRLRLPSRISALPFPWWRHWCRHGNFVDL